MTAPQQTTLQDVRCEHGQEKWCRICGTVEQKIETKVEEKRDYSNARPNTVHYYYDRLTGKMEEKK